MKKITTITKTLALAALAVVASMTVVSCGSDDPATPDTSGGSSDKKETYVPTVAICYAVDDSTMQDFDLTVTYTDENGETQKVVLDKTNTKKVAMLDSTAYQYEFSKTLQFTKLPQSNLTYKAEIARKVPLSEKKEYNITVRYGVAYGNILKSQVTDAASALYLSAVTYGLSGIEPAGIDTSLSAVNYELAQKNKTLNLSADGTFSEVK